MLITLDVPDGLLNDARRALTFSTKEGVVLGSVVQAGLSNAPMQRHIND